MLASDVHSRIKVIIGLLFLLLCIFQYGQVKYQKDLTNVKISGVKRRIIVITPTHKRPERLADFTMLAQTLAYVKDMFWIVVEDGNKTVDKVEQIIKRTTKGYAYLHTTNMKLPCKGWAQRNLALKYLRDHKNHFTIHDVIYFADDDNAYDVRLFGYIRKVDKLGVWAVGLAGGTFVESPISKNGSLIGWSVYAKPKRKYATDMSGFAVNMNLVLKKNATFNYHCAGTYPEDCFLSQVKVSWPEVQVFGYKNDVLLVWHRRTSLGDYKKPANDNGYFYEEKLPESNFCGQLQEIGGMSYDEVMKVVASEKG